MPTLQRYQIGSEGIVSVDSVYGPPDFLLVHNPFSVWVLRNHPDDRTAIERCEWTSLEDARTTGTRTGELFVEWAAHLDEIGCAFNDTACATKATLDGFLAAYDAGNIDAAMAYFVPESEITNHPVGGDVSGREAVRTALEQHRAQAAESEPYAEIDLKVAGFTARWDHTWLDNTGQQWCSSNNSPTTAGGFIIRWTHADEVPCE